MVVQKLGKAILNLEKEFWSVEGKPTHFIVNPRLIDTRPEVKAVKAEYEKSRRHIKPPYPRAKRHYAHLEARAGYVKQMKSCLARLYEEIRAESFQVPIRLRGANDMDHGHDWRYCLFEGVIYQFDKPGYTDGEMVEQIKSLT